MIIIWFLKTCYLIRGIENQVINSSVNLAQFVDDNSVKERLLKTTLSNHFNRLFEPKKYKECLLLLQDASTVEPFNFQEQDILRGLKDKLLLTTEGKAEIEKVIGNDCGSVDDCIGKYNFLKARQIIGGYVYQSARTKDLVKIIRAEATYWIGKKQYDKAEEVGNEVGGIDPTFFDDSFLVILPEVQKTPKSMLSILRMRSKLRSSRALSKKASYPKPKSE